LRAAHRRSIPPKFRSSDRRAPGRLVALSAGDDSGFLHPSPTGPLPPKISARFALSSAPPEIEPEMTVITSTPRYKCEFSPRPSAMHPRQASIRRFDLELRRSLSAVGLDQNSARPICPGLLNLLTSGAFSGQTEAFGKRKTRRQLSRYRLNQFSHAGDFFRCQRCADRSRKSCLGSSLRRTEKGYKSFRYQVTTPRRSHQRVASGLRDCDSLEFRP
jgi:hypothetical protein